MDLSHAAQQSIHDDNFVEFVRLYNDHNLTHSTYSLVKYAIREGKLRFVIYLYTKCSPRERGNLCRIAAGYGKTKCLKFLHGAGCDIDRALSIAAHNGKLGCVRYLLKYIQPDKSLLEEISATGYTKILTELYSAGGYMFTISPSMNSNAIKTLLRLGAKWDVQSMHSEAARGDLLSIQRLYKFRHSVDAAVFDELINTAALHGRINIIKYLHYHGHDISEMAMAYCAMNGIEVLRQVHALGGPMSALVASACVNSRDAAALAYALNNGCVCSSYMISYSKTYPLDPVSQVIVSAIKKK